MKMSLEMAPHGDNAPPPTSPFISWRYGSCIYPFTANDEGSSMVKVLLQRTSVHSKIAFSHIPEELMDIPRYNSMAIQFCKNIKIESFDYF